MDSQYELLRTVLIFSGCFVASFIISYIYHRWRTRWREK